MSIGSMSNSCCGGDKRTIYESVADPCMKLDKMAQVAAHHVSQLTAGPLRKSRSLSTKSSLSLSLNCDCSRTKLSDVTVVGLHKRSLPKTSYFYIILVTWKDGSHVTLYRKCKEIRNFQRDLNQEISHKTLNGEALHYLSKLKRKTTLCMMTSLMGTMRRLHTIDKINLYFQALTYYFKDTSKWNVLTKFFELTKDDINLDQRSKFGKTYFYVSRSIINRRDVIIENHSVSQSMENLYEQENSSCSSCVTSLDDDDIYQATDDYQPSDADLRQKIIQLHEGDRVQVLRRSETGWWFVQRINGMELSGYVPASHLRKTTVSRSSYYASTISLSTSEGSIPLESNYSTDAPTPPRPYSFFQQRTGSVCSFKSTERFYYMATRDYTSKNPDELSLEKGDTLQILQKRVDGWWTARRGSEEGLVPAVHLTATANDPIRRLSSKIYTARVSTP